MKTDLACGVVAMCVALGYTAAAHGVDEVTPVVEAPRPDERAALAAARPPAEALLPVVPCRVRDDLDVLFIGNSYTIAHDINLQVAKMADAAGLKLRTRRLALPGKNLEYHARRSKVRAALARRSWDFVVLQGQSLEPLRSPEAFRTSGSELAQMVWDAGATPIFFETWPRKEGHPIYRQKRRLSRGSPTAMYEAIHRAYAELALETSAELVPAGQAWMAMARRAPTVNLYDYDLHHPGRRGSYLNANLLFAHLTNVSPVGNVGEPQVRIEPDVAQMIQEIARATVRPECERVPESPPLGGARHERRWHTARGSR